MLMRGGDPVLSAGLVAEMTRDQLTPEQRTGSSPDLIVIVLTQIGFGSPEPPAVHRDLRSAALAAARS
jgi:hypothetical protein